MPMELQLLYADISIPCAIENIEALKAELQPKLEHYKSLVVTEDSIKTAKEDKANLNKLKKAIDEQRISVKKKCLEPYEVLEKECREVEKPILEAIKAIDDQIKAFDEKEKTEKLEKLKEAFDNTGHHDWLKLENVLSEKWANKTEKLEKLIEEINKAVDRVNAEYAEITNMYFDSPLLTAIADQYKRTRNKAETLAYAVTLEKQYQAEQEHKKQEEEARQRENIKNAVICPDNSRNEIIPESTKTAVGVEYGANQSMPKEIDSVTFMVWGEKSKESINKLKEVVKLMKSLGLNYKVINGGN